MSECENWGDYDKQLAEQCRKMRVPLRVGFELTPLCNFRCKMCFIRLDKSQQEKTAPMMTAEQWIDIAKQACDMGALDAVLTGGEVFTRPDFRKIYEAISDMGYIITIYTNGYLISDEVIEWLAKDKLLTVRVSLYGASDKTYQKVTGVSDGFTRVTKNIELMRKAGITVKTTMTVIKDNEDDVLAVREYVRAQGISLSTTHNIIHQLPGRQREYNTVSPDYLSRFAENLKPFQSTGSTDPFARCAIKGCSCWLTWDGHMQLCPAFYLIRENAETFSESWKILNQRLDTLERPKKCQTCQYQSFCMQCLATMMTKSGSLTDVDEKCCEEAKFIFNIKQRCHSI